MDQQELMRYYTIYRDKHKMPDDRAKKKAITSYNAVHPKDPLPKNAWDLIGEGKDAMIALAQQETALITNLKLEVTELKEALTEAAGQINRQDNELEVLRKENPKLRDEVKELTEALDEATRPVIDAPGSETKTESSAPVEPVPATTKTPKAGDKPKDKKK